MAYEGYRIKDFLLDERFRRWVLEPDPELSAFWDQWMKGNPENTREAHRAWEILSMLRFKEHYPGRTDQAEVWAKIEEVIRSDEQIVQLPLARKAAIDPVPADPGRRRRWLRYAGVLAGLLFAGLLALYLHSRLPVTYATGYGEVRTILLPDNSVVKLNANSSLRHYRNWDKEREVWVDGEAFFTVTHQSDHQRFLVHTGDVTVQVLGTEFNVNSRHVATSVVLNNGSIRLHLNPVRSASNPVRSGSSESKAPEDLIMQPGEMVSWSSTTGQLVTRKVDPELHTSWRTNVLTFRDTPVREVVQSLKDNFNLDIRLENDPVEGETFTGTIPMDNVPVFFKTLSRSLNVTIIEKNEIIYIIYAKEGDDQ